MPAIVLIGEGALALLCLEALEARGLVPEQVCSFDGSLAEACTRRGRPHVEHRDDVCGWLAEQGCDYLLSVRNPWIVPATALAAVRRLAINFHDSPLPRYAGLHATSWALLHGEREHGISWHEITPGIDEGRLLAQVMLPIADDDTALTLNAKCLEAAASAFSRVLDVIESGTARLTAQSGSRSYFSGRDRPAAHCAIDCERPARAIVDLVRALDFGHTHNPLGLPKLWANGRALVVRRAQALAAPSTAAPGTVLACDDTGLRMATQTTDVVLMGLAGLDGAPLSADELEAELGPWRGRLLPSLTSQARAQLSALDRRVVRHEGEWARRLGGGTTPVEHPYAPAGAWGGLEPAPLPRLRAALQAVAPAQRRARARAVIAAYLARSSATQPRDLGVVQPALHDECRVAFAPIVPLRMPARTLSFAAFERALADTWAEVERRGTFPRDLGPRVPSLRSNPGLPTRWPVAVVEARALPPGLDRDVAFVFGLPPDDDGDVQLWVTHAVPAAWRESLDAQLAVLAHAAAADDQVPVARLPRLDRALRERVLVTWNATQRPLPDVCVHERFEQQAHRTPHAPAVCFGDEVLSYAELEAGAKQLAHALRERGVREGDRVALSLSRSTGMVVGLLAVLYAGGSYVPIDSNLPRERIALMLRRSEPGLVLTDAATHAAMLAAAPDHAATILSLHADAAFIHAQPRAAIACRSDPERVAYVIFTSGSTGEPKAVEIRHRSLVNHALAVQDHYALGPGDRMLCSASIGFDVAAEQIYPVLLHGAAVVVRPDDLFESFQGFDAFVRTRGITTLALPTALWHEWVRFLVARELPVPPSLRVLGVGTEKALGETLAAWRERGAHHVRFLQGYGPTEATITCTMFQHDGRDVDPAHPLPIGRPLANTEIYLLDDDGEPVPPGIPGELHVGGLGLARGYLGRDDLTAERFIPHPFRQDGDARLYKTGDIARYESDGQLVFVGRADFQVKIRGFRVELGEIEAVLRSRPEVSDAVVVLRRDPAEPERLVAYLLASAGVDVTTLEAQARARLPEYMVPAAFVVMDAFPLTHNGKVDRTALPRPASTPRPTASAGPRDALERQLAQAFAAALRLPAVGIHDGFFALGGDSLHALIMLERLESALSRSISLGQLFRTSSIAALAEHLRQRELGEGEGEGEEEAEEQPSVIPLKGGHGTPLFLAMGVHMYQELVAALPGSNPAYAVVQPVESAMIRRNEPLPSIPELARRNVALLRAHTPEGPYAIGGFSFGGFVAYEMAQLLTRQGQEVSVLALFDCILPRGRRPGLRVSTRFLVDAIAAGQASRLLRRAANYALRSLPLRPRTSGASRALETDAERLRAARDDAYGQRIEDYDRVIEPYRGTVALYRSLALRLPVLPYHGFDRLVTGRLVAHDVPGDHDALLQPGNAERVARHLHTLLTPAQNNETDARRTHLR